MNPSYLDIRRKIAEAPTWFDDNGTPRYCPFHPEEAPNIYATECLLLRIRCQACGEVFHVSITYSRPFGTPPSEFMRDWLAHAGKGRRMCPVHYGDPPAHGCVGDTMNCIDMRVLEFWHHAAGLGDWQRVAEFEVDLEDEQGGEQT